MPPEKKFPHFKKIRLTDELMRGITEFRLAHRDGDGPHAPYMTEQEGPSGGLSRRGSKLSQSLRDLPELRSAA
jgi:hypothetical protein